MATAAPSDASARAIWRPTSRAAPVTSATRPSSPNFIALLLFGFCAPDKLKQSLWRHRQLIDLDAEWGQRIGDGVGDSGRRADGSTFAHAAEATDGGRGSLHVHHVHRRHLAGGRHQVVHKAGGEELAVLVIDDLFVERGADALRDPAAHLTVDDQWVDELAAVLGDDVRLEANSERGGIYVENGDMRSRRGRPEHRIVSGAGF